MKAKIVNVPGPLNGVDVEIIGISFDVRPQPGTIYIIERLDGQLFSYPTGEQYKAMGLTGSCLQF